MEYKKEAEIPDGVELNIDKNIISVKGEKGEIKKEFKDPRLKYITIEKSGNKLVVTSNSRRKTKSMVGTICAYAKNMIKGVTKGYEYKMKIHYSHFPITLEVRGSEIALKNFLGEKGTRKTKLIGDTKVDVKKDEIVITGINKEDVGQTAANIEMAAKVSRMDKRIFHDGVYVSRKSGEEK